MNFALWRKAVTDSWLQLLISCAILILFAWLFVWLTAQFKAGMWTLFLDMAPDFVKRMMPVPPKMMITPAGRLSVLYVHLITLLVCVGWAVGRGSDMISGEIGRGTADLLLSLPVRRASTLIAPGTIATLGAAVVALSIWLGTVIGLWLTGQLGEVGVAQFLPGVLNLCALTVCFTGVTVLISSLGRDRWRTILLSGGFFVLSMIVALVGRLWPAGSWLRYLTFFAAFKPQELILLPEADTSPLACNATLFGLGLVGYLVAAVILTWRDIPAPR